MNSKKRTLLLRVCALVLLVAVAALMMVLGRGHTIYFDNRSLEYEGKTYEAPYKIVVISDGEQISKLYEKDRGMDICIGQRYEMTLELTQEKGGEEVTNTYSLKLPYNMDGIIVNLPAFLAGLPQEAYISEFVSGVAGEPAQEDEPITDEFGLPEPEF